MATRNVSLTPEQDAFVKSLVKSGEYQNASEAVRDALRVLQHRHAPPALSRLHRAEQPRRSRADNQHIKFVSQVLS